MMSRSSAVAVGLLVLGGIGAPFVVRVVRAMGSTEPEGRPSKAIDAPRTVDPVFGDWFALGSRCRARPSQPGDVELEFVPAKALEPNLHVARFHMPAFQLGGEALDGGMATSSECSLRLAVNPGAGFRIRDVRAHTSLAGQRPLDSEVRLTEELKLGSFPIQTVRSSYSAGASARDIPVDVLLGTDTPGGAKHPLLACGENKLVAFDFTWLSRLGASKEPTHVGLAGEKTVDIDIVLEPCEDGGPVPSSSTPSPPHTP
jgi:hypothetical protein